MHQTRHRCPIEDSTGRPVITPTRVDHFRLWERRPPTGCGVWQEGDHLVVARPDLVKRVLLDNDRFGVGNALDAVTAFTPMTLRRLASHSVRLPPTLANNDGPDHPGIRAIVAEATTPRRVARLRPWLIGLVRRRVASLMPRLRAGEPVDLHRALCADIPLAALGRLMELPDDEVATVNRFSRAALELFWSPTEPDRQRLLAEAVGVHHDRLRRFVGTAGGMVARLRRHCRDHGLGDDPVIAALFFLLVAGQETTSQFLALLLHRLTGEPGVLTGLVGGTVTAEAVVEEGLRWEPPIVSWRRIATDDTTLAGVPVAAGQSVLLWLAAAGRQVGEFPGRFVPGQRGSRRHLAFGAGAHRCVGAHLARMEAAVVVAETAALLRGCVVSEPFECIDNLSFRMPRGLIVRRAAAGSFG
ncbi:cytochrome P450 [Stackebrandtia endophytica]|uniref:Cytochrome P450 n=1 Tax=Stackebrandtia endophytica TaxID=1496996 RepID=A0A543B273_9ACTN|nr:cytochrome P450 [Stackebrandtia endophytica]TQL78937.1 cytochrome P450 [Stackebrandtia endophytica]